MEENVQKKNAEKEAKQSLASSSSTTIEKSKDKGKSIVYGPIRTQPSSTLEALHISIEFRNGLENLTVEMKAQAAVTKLQPKRQKVQEAPPQAKTQ